MYRLRNTRITSFLNQNYIIYYQERNYSMLSGMSIPKERRGEELML
jgi:hypothetical protein